MSRQRMVWWDLGVVAVAVVGDVGLVWAMVVDDRKWRSLGRPPRKDAVELDECGLLVVAR